MPPWGPSRTIAFIDAPPVHPDLDPFRAAYKTQVTRLHTGEPEVGSWHMESASLVLADGHADTVKPAHEASTAYPNRDYTKGGYTFKTRDLP